MTSILTQPNSVVEPVASSPSPVRRRPGRFQICFSAAILIVIALVVLGANLLSPFDPNAQELSNILQGPSGAHWLGTDDLGRDVLSRMLFGTRVSVLAGLLAVTVAVGIGLPLGVAAGYLGKTTDAVLMRFNDTLLAFPAIILAIGITATMGPGIVNAMVAVGIVLSPSIARLARAQTMAVKQETYVEAARSFGARGFQGIVMRHILPNMIQPILVQAAILMGYALLAEASLSFLQLGVEPPTASWGTILSRAYTFIDYVPLQIVVPGVAIALTVFAFNVIGDEAQRILDPRRRTRR